MIIAFIHPWHGGTTNIVHHGLFYRMSDCQCDTTKVKHILQQHRNYAVTATDEEDFQRIHIRRSSLFHDAYRQFSRDSFDATKMLKVVFIGK